METFIQKYDNGKIKSKIHVKKKGNVEYGKIQYFFLNGVMNSQISYKNGERDGKLISYYNNGEIRVSSIYKNGVRHGHTKHYYENGILKMTLFYRNDILNGKHVMYFTNGKVQSIIRFKNNLRHGKTEYFNKNGSPSVICSFKDNKLNGKLISFYEGNLLKIICNYKNGVIDGYERKYLYDNRKKEYILYHQLKYKQNLLSGKILFFYSNGNILMSTSYKDNKKNGFSIMYDFEGKQLYKHHYVNDTCRYEFVKTRKGNECCICYDTIHYKTKCCHFICSSCFHVLEEKKCPICRKYF
jgi:antitoxin component YwqK of YwqJK toxin-antitoxin module